MTEPISVEARFEPDGTLTPLAFEWQGRRYTIQSHGRRWKKNGIHHFLIMVMGDQIFELVYLQDKHQWKLKRTPQNFKPRPSI